MGDFINSLSQSKIVSSIIVIIISFAIYRVIKNISAKSEKNSRLNNKLNKKSKTYIKMTNSIIKAVFIMVTILIILQINGVDVSSMLAGVGIASVIIGLAVQDALKDIIRGINIISDGYFSLGDVVTYGEYTGKVLAIGLRTTKIQDIATDNIISIANRNIEQVQIVSNSLYVNFPMPYELPVDTAEEVIQDIMEEIKQVNDVEEVIYKGVKELAESSIKYLLKIVCIPERRLQVKRDALGCILRVLEKNNINVPYNQIDIHQK